MVTKSKTWLLLAALVGFFAVAGIVQWIFILDHLSVADRTAPATDSGGTNTDGDGTLETFDNVLLIYSDGIAHVAKRYLEAESYETAIVLLERVVRVRRGVLGAEDHSVREAQTLLSGAKRSHHGKDGIALGAGKPAEEGGD